MCRSPRRLPLRFLGFAQRCLNGSLVMSLRDVECDVRGGAGDLPWSFRLMGVVIMVSRLAKYL